MKISDLLKGMIEGHEIEGKRAVRESDLMMIETIYVNGEDTGLIFFPETFMDLLALHGKEAQWAYVDEVKGAVEQWIEENEK